MKSRRWLVRRTPAIILCICGEKLYPTMLRPDKCRKCGTIMRLKWRRGGWSRPIASVAVAHPGYEPIIYAYYEWMLTDRKIPRENEVVWIVPPDSNYMVRMGYKDGSWLNKEGLAYHISYSEYWRECAPNELNWPDTVIFASPTDGKHTK